MKTTKTKISKGQYLITKGDRSVIAYLDQFGRWEMRTEGTDEWCGDFKTLKRAVNAVNNY